MSWQLAQFNVARMRFPLDDERMSGFKSELDPVNALADASPGFVWRHQTDEGDSTAIRMYDDPDIIINFSVWESIEALKTFTYNLPEHKNLLRQRRSWFEPVEGMPVLVMWWIPSGTLPTLEEARMRQERLHLAGPSEEAFTFRTIFPAPIGKS